MTKSFNLNRRWFYLVIGVFAMLFSGVLYAWSILKTPFAVGYKWEASVLSLNYTLTICFFLAFMSCVLDIPYTQFSTHFDTTH